MNYTFYYFLPSPDLGLEGWCMSSWTQKAKLNLLDLLLKSIGKKVLKSSEVFCQSLVKYNPTYIFQYSLAITITLVASKGRKKSYALFESSVYRQSEKDFILLTFFFFCDVYAHKKYYGNPWLSKDKDSTECTQLIFLV